MEEGVYNSRTRAPVTDAPSWEASSQGHDLGLHEVTLFDVLTQLAYRKWLIAKVTAIATLTGFTMSLLLPVRYTATTKIMPPQQTQSTASMMMNQLANISKKYPVTAHSTFY